MRKRQDLTTIFFFTFLVVMAGFMLFTTIAKAATKPAGQIAAQNEPVSEAWGVLPKFRSSLTIYRKIFIIRTQFILSESIGAGGVKNLLRREDLIKDYIPEVQSAKFSKPNSKGDYNLILNIANLWGVVYSATFKCRDDGDSNAVLDQDCTEMPNKSSPLLGKGIFNIDCNVFTSLDSSAQHDKPNGPSLQCVFGMSGTLQDAVFRWSREFANNKMTVPGPVIAYDLYTATTSYAMQIAMQAGEQNEKACTGTKHDFVSCAINFANELDALTAPSQVIKVKKIPSNETFFTLLFPNGQIKSKTQYGDYLLESQEALLPNSVGEF